MNVLKKIFEVKKNINSNIRIIQFDDYKPQTQKCQNIFEIINSNENWIKIKKFFCARFIHGINELKKFIAIEFEGVC